MSVKKNGLSEREFEVLQLIVEGLTDRQIAYELGITQHTANAHRKSLVKKMKVNNTASLVAAAFRKRLVK
ncbi:MAG TPA: LuxR C-terminal-related transcriptional regulator [Chitinophagales bacterium]|nr:LuxR C-terminal-related transcriptional regulator [Chitinophagales bacterium]